MDPYFAPIFTGLLAMAVMAYLAHTIVREPVEDDHTLSIAGSIEAGPRPSSEGSIGR